MTTSTYDMFNDTELTVAVWRGANAGGANAVAEATKKAVHRAVNFMATRIYDGRKEGRNEVKG